jgi:hypothetical protein
MSTQTTEGIIEAMEREVRERLLSLARTFPTLAARGVASIQDVILVMDNNALSPAARRSANFVLSVWNVTRYPCDQRRCWMAWDDAHREAFKAWGRDPWWA